MPFASARRIERNNFGRRAFWTKKQRCVNTSNCTGTQGTTHQVSRLPTLLRTTVDSCEFLRGSGSVAHSAAASSAFIGRRCSPTAFTNSPYFRLWLRQLHSRRNFDNWARLASTTLSASEARRRNCNRVLHGLDHRHPTLHNQLVHEMSSTLLWLHC